MKKSRVLNSVIGGVVGLASLSAAFGSVPKNVTNDTALYQNLSEIKANRERELNFDRDISQLAASEGKYHERLPELSARARVQRPMQRISQKSYRYSGSSSPSRSRSARR